jgi:hypothetical protein
MRVKRSTARDASSSNRFKKLWPQRLWVHITLLVLSGFVLTAGVAALSWWLLGGPELVVSPLNTRGLIDALKLVLAVVGGIGAIVALTIAYRKQRHGEAAEYREETKLFNDRYAKAAELLGHERAAARMAGVYSMARLADDAETTDASQQCVDALCSYLRLPYSPGDTSSEAKGEGTVRTTTLRVIRDHLRPDTGVASWDGHKFNLAGAVFHAGDLSKIQLTGGHITFHGASFVTDIFDMTDMKIVSPARIWFTGVRFAGGDVRFGGTEFNALKASFDKVQFDDGKVSFEGVKELQPVTFDGVRVGGADVKWGPFHRVPASMP